MKTTKTIYLRSGIYGNQYAPGNVSPFGSKWRITLSADRHGYWRETGLARLIDANWDIDDAKIEETDRFLSVIGLGKIL